MISKKRCITVSTVTEPSKKFVSHTNRNIKQRYYEGSDDKRSLCPVKHTRENKSHELSFRREEVDAFWNPYLHPYTSNSVTVAVEESWNTLVSWLKLRVCSMDQMEQYSTLRLALIAEQRETILRLLYFRQSSPDLVEIQEGASDLFTVSTMH